MNKRRLCLGSILISFIILISSGAYAAADINAGKVAATQCAVCHGLDSEGNGIPNSSIAGMDVDTFKQHLIDFKSGFRKNVMMQRFANRLSDQDIENLAAYYATK